jgi:hypothetical protein
MIPARPGFVVRFELKRRGRGANTTRPIEAWSSEGEPLLAGRHKLERAYEFEEIDGREVVAWSIDYIDPYPPEAEG